MKKMKWLTATAVVLAFGATLAFAAPGEGKGKGKWGKDGQARHGGGGYGPRFAEKLNLTEAQKAQLEQLRATFKESNKALSESSNDTKRQYHEAKKAGDTARVQALQPAYDAYREQMKQVKEAQKQQVRAILTAEQRAQLDAMQAERGERGKGRRREK